MQPLRLLLSEVHGAGRALLLLAPFVLSACPDASGPPPCEEGPIDCTHAHDVPATIEVGTGDPELPGFEPLPADGRLPLFLGPQAGYHVYIQARSTGLCPNAVAMSRKVREPGEAQVLRSQISKLRMDDGGDGSWVFPRAQPTFICPATLPGIRMDDREFELEVTLTEEAGCDETVEPRSVSTTVTIIPTCAETDIECRDTNAPGCAPL